MRHDYPALVHLAQAYFHQDWMLDHASSNDVVDAFLNGTPDLAPRIATEVDRALAEHATEEQARRFTLDDLDPYYRVEADGLTYRAWLQSIADRARAMGF